MYEAALTLVALPAAISLDRDLLRELLDPEGLRELIDPDALAEVEADLQRTSERTRAARAGPACTTSCARSATSPPTKAQAHCLPAVSALREMLAELEEEAEGDPDADRQRGETLARRRGRRGSTATRSAPFRRAGFWEAFLEAVEGRWSRLTRRCAHARTVRGDRGFRRATAWTWRRCC